MTLMDYCMQYIGEIMDGKRAVPEGVTLTETDPMRRSLELLQKAGDIPTLVRMCAAQDGTEIPQEVFDSFDPESLTQLAGEGDAAPEEPEQPQQPDPDAGKHAFQVLLDCVALDDGLVQYLTQVLRDRERVFATENSDGCIAEGLPVVRKGKIKAWVSIMYGCNNFCTYCIVPYVRGRERSRDPERIVAEVEQLVAEGYKDITLLGQNVNSYGKDLGMEMDFADLLARIDAIPGDFFVRFMTSHPRDASQKLFETMARCLKVAPQLHLPFQSGSNRVLGEMNRG